MAIYMSSSRYLGSASRGTDVHRVAYHSVILAHGMVIQLNLVALARGVA